MDLWYSCIVICVNSVLRVVPLGHRGLITVCVCVCVCVRVCACVRACVRGHFLAIFSCNPFDLLIVSEIAPILNISLFKDERVVACPNPEVGPPPPIDNH